MQNRQFILKSRPEYLAGPENFDLKISPVLPLKQGEARVAVEMVALSAWQGMRTKDFKNFIRPFDLGELIDCDVFGKIIETKCSELPEGVSVVGRLGWQDYAVIKPEQVSIVSKEFSAEEWLTALSSPGQTPYLALSQVARPMPGETLVVSSAAGAIGVYTVQLGLLSGMRVIGIAGGSRKTEFVTTKLKAHACVDYKSKSFKADLANACHDGANIYFDLVGGETADAVSENLAKNAKILMVGRVSANNSNDPEWDPANMRHVWSQEATIYAFSRYSYKNLFQSVNAKIGRLLKQKLLKMHNTNFSGFENTPSILNQMLSGQHVGKVLIKYADTKGNRI
jgi:NADPH-dependent curcumin reductase CurA